MCALRTADPWCVVWAVWACACATYGFRNGFAWAAIFPYCSPIYSLWFWNIASFPCRVMYESIYFIHPPSFMFHAFGNCEACIKFGAMSDRRTGLTWQHNANNWMQAERTCSIQCPSIWICNCQYFWLIGGSTTEIHSRSAQPSAAFDKRRSWSLIFPMRMFSF